MHTLHTTYYMHTCVLRAQLVSNSIHNLHNIHTSYYYSISSMYSSYSSGWDDRELAKEAGSRWSITQQQLYNSQQYQQYYYYSRVVGVRVVVLLRVQEQIVSVYVDSFVDPIRRVELISTYRIPQLYCTYSRTLEYNVNTHTTREYLLDMHSSTSQQYQLVVICMQYELLLMPVCRP